MFQVGLLLFVAATVASASRLHVILSTQSVDNLIESGLSVYGTSGQLIAVVGDETPVGVLFSTTYDSTKYTYFFAEDAVIQDWNKLATTAPENALQVLVDYKKSALFCVHAGLMAKVTKLFPLSTEIITLAAQPWRSVQANSLARLNKIARGLSYRQEVADLVKLVSTSSLQGYVRYLTGEDPASPLISRNSYSEGGVVAGIWVASVFQNDGFTTERPVFNDLYCPNVIAELPGSEPDKIVVVGAHLDDRATNLNDPNQVAPGANDDGSGSAMLLEIARIIAQTNATFRYTLRIVAFCGEEQGLVGSRAYARELADQNADIVAMLQGDMIAYQAGTTPELSMVNRYVDQTLTSIVKNTTTTYVPTLRQSDTSACCSDHQSFYENGYPSAGFVEAGGYTIDPQYHREGDLSARSGYSFQQLAQITQAILASAAVLAQLN